MDKTAIYNALDPAWWTSQTNEWLTTYVSTVILYNTAAITGCTYTSSCAIQTDGLNSSPTDAPDSELGTTIDILRLEGAQRLYDMHTTAITGHQPLGFVYNATN